MQAESGGGFLVQRAHRRSPRASLMASSGNAQVAQRARGPAKRPTQLRHAGSEGQRRHSAHWLGMMLETPSSH
jgi:hypothetical protein